MKDAAYSVAVNGHNRTDRGLSTLPSAGLAERRPTAYARWLTNRTAPCKQGGVRRRVRRRYLSMDRLYSISRELLSGPFGHIFFVFVRFYF